MTHLIQQWLSTSHILSESTIKFEHHIILLSKLLKSRGHATKFVADCTFSIYYNTYSIYENSIQLKNY
jgi:hypothetical protein